MSTRTVVTMGAGVGGMGLASPLTILFVALKLTHTIDWSWVWVLSPIWIGAALYVVLITSFIALAVTSLKDW